MTTIAIESTQWLNVNQGELADAIARMKKILRSHAIRLRSTQLDRESDGTHAHVAVADGNSHCTSDTLDALCVAFSLSDFERDLLLLCACEELDSEFGPIFRDCQGDVNRNFPSFSLALAALPNAHWSSLLPTSPLRHWRLIEVGPGPSITTARLHIDERILHFIVGLQYLDPRIASIVEMVDTSQAVELAQSQAMAIDRIVLVSGLADGKNSPIIELCGSDSGECRMIAALAAQALGFRMAAIVADQIPLGVELDEFATLWERETALDGMILLIENAEQAVDMARSNVLNRLVDRLAVPIMVSTRERRPIHNRPVVSVDVGRPEMLEQRVAWMAALGDDAENHRETVDGISMQFNLTLSAIRSAAIESLAASDSESSFAQNAWDVCRSHSRTRMGDLAQRIEPSATWSDLVLPEPQAHAVRQIAVQVRHRHRVHHQWGFASKGSRSLGISALFCGASGTGKTMAAEVLASELRLDLYRIDLACIVSKYIGETEKNLRRIFDKAEDGAAILLFDEADALFGKRSEVKDSHDRYANIEVSYLLQRMESYRGLAILTTNMRTSIDGAFLRRLRFVVEFPLPTSIQRAEIWRRIFPVDAPTQGLDYNKLARLNIPGGNIRNIALCAAFLAAEAGTPIRMSHIREAATVEYNKIERSLTESETGGWDE